MTESDQSVSSNSKKEREEEDLESEEVDETWLNKLDFSAGQSLTDSWVSISSRYTAKSLSHYRAGRKSGCPISLQENQARNKPVWGTVTGDKKTASRSGS
jgi:hypothetical protein